MCRRQATALMPVLLASERNGDYQTLNALRHDTKWSVARALSWGEVSSFCGRVASPVVLVDRHSFLASQYYSQLLFDLTLGRLRPVLME